MFVRDTHQVASFIFVCWCCDGPVVLSLVGSRRDRDKEPTVQGPGKFRVKYRRILRKFVYGYWFPDLAL